MSKRLTVLILVVVLGVSVFAAACGNGGTPETTAAPSGEPFKIGFNTAFTDFMAYDEMLAQKGMKTGLAMIDNQIMGRPVVVIERDYASDPAQAVEKARELAEGEKVHCMVGPIFSPATAAVTGFLGTSTGIPDFSIMGQPSDNLATASGLAFIPQGLYGSQGYYFGKYCGEVLGYRSANCIHYEDTAAYQLQEGFERGFAEFGGEITSINYTPMDTVDFSPWLSAMKPADCTLFWVFGNGAVPFVQQYNQYGLKAPLVVPMANNFDREQLGDLGDMSVGMVACDIYVDSVDNSENKAFVEKYQEFYPGEYPMPQGYAAQQALFMFAKAVETTGGDTTPAKLIEALSTMSINTPAGKLTMKPYKDAFIPIRDFFILEVKKVGDGYQWVILETLSQVEMGE